MIIAKICNYLITDKRADLAGLFKKDCLKQGGENMKVVKKIEDQKDFNASAVSPGGWCCSCCCWCWVNIFN